MTFNEPDRPPCFPIDTFFYPAPTKVILFGEDSVVYGHSAVSLAIEQCMVVCGSVFESPSAVYLS
jgi:mevalonate kinase